MGLAVQLKFNALAGIFISEGAQRPAAAAETHEIKYVQWRQTIAPEIVCTGINRRLEQVRRELRDEIRQSVPCTMPTINP